MNWYELRYDWKQNKELTDWIRTLNSKGFIWQTGKNNRPGITFTDPESELVFRMKFL